MNIVKYKKISYLLCVVSFVFGLFVASSIMIGDTLGRVNILYLLLLFICLPLLSLLFLLFVKLRMSNLSLVKLLLSSSIIPRHWLPDDIDGNNSSVYSGWLFYLSQKAYLFFNLGCLLGFLCVLLISDVTFIWRSTLLTSEQLFPIVKLFAYPWIFIDSAQPLSAVFELSQDSRLQQNMLFNDQSNWWQYVLMCQIVYAIFPRVLLYIWSKRSLNTAIKKCALEEESIAEFNNAQRQGATKVSLQELVMFDKPFKKFLLLYWTELPEKLQLEIKHIIGFPEEEYTLGSSNLLNLEQRLINDDRKKVLIVPSWEPPLGELADFMLQSQGYLIPVDWKKSQIQSLDVAHLDEWRRFCYHIPHWQLLSNKAFI